jgi:hypothetical protein
MGKSGSLDQAEDKIVISGVRLSREMGCADAQTPEAQNHEIQKSRSSELGRCHLDGCGPMGCVPCASGP